MPQPARGSSPPFDPSTALRRILSQVDPHAQAPLSFREFIALVHPRYKWYRHCEELVDVLQRVADGEITRLMVFMPPRHGKSETTSRLFSAYYVYRHPDRFVGLTSYSADLAYTLSRAARDRARAGGVAIRDDVRATGHWETSRGGGMWAAGVGGPITGKGCHLGIIDDPLKNDIDAASETVRAHQKEWYQATFSTRLEPDAALVVVQTRWHADDLSGWLLSEESGDEEPEGWYIVHLPGLAEEEAPEYPASCTVHPDWRLEGEALCPERYPLGKLKAICRRIGQYFWSALFQQRPVPRAGGMFQLQWFRKEGAPPAQFAAVVRYWDKAGALPGRGDWTVGVLMGRAADGYYWILDVVRGQWPGDERNKVILETAKADRHAHPGVKVWVEQPPGLAKESTDTVVRLLAGFAVQADPVHRDKVERAGPVSDQLRAGNVRMIAAPWNVPYLAVMCSFPTGAHDDDVDATSGAFNKLAGKREYGWA